MQYFTPELFSTTGYYYFTRMHLKKLQLSLLTSLLAFGFLSAQDIHFTQFTMSPMTLNPANIGGFEGTVRIGGIYRSQWTSVLSKNQFETPSGWVDAPLIRGFRKKDWVGAGLMLFQDNVGAGKLTHSANKLGAAYHIGLGKKSNTVIAIGGHYGQETYRINDENLQFEDGFINSTVPGEYQATQSADNTAIPDGDQRPKANFKDVDAGITISSKLNATMDFKLGFSMFHIGQARFSLLTAGGGGGGNTTSFRQARRSILHGTFNVKTNDRLTISPSFIFQTMNKQDEIDVQALAGYLFNPEKDITLNFGVGYRLGDAINLLAGAKVKSLTVGVAYDVNTSGLNNDTRYRGGFEIAANYIIKIYKKATVKPKILCPRF